MWFGCVLCRWTSKEQNKCRSGYSSWEIKSFAGEANYYHICVDEWNESGALHFTGRGTLDDFLKVRCRGRSVVCAS